MWELSDADRKEIMDVLKDMARTDPRPRNRQTAIKQLMAADRLNIAWSALELEKKKLEGGTDLNSLLVVAAKISELHSQPSPSEDSQISSE